MKKSKIENFPVFEGKLPLNKDRRYQFDKAVEDVKNCGYLTFAEEIAPAVFAVRPSPHGIKLAAWELASRLPGQIWPGRRGVSWVCGRDGPHGMLIESESYPEVLKAREILQHFKIDLSMGYSVGRISRALLQWVKPPNKCPCTTDNLLRGLGVSFEQCLPGRYEHAIMYDARSYWFQLLNRVRSLSLVVDKSGRLFWEPMRPDEASRFRDLKIAVSEDKLLRNSIVGSAMGSSRRMPYYAKGPGKPTFERNGETRLNANFDPNATAHEVKLKLPGGDYRGVGLLIIRSAYELCREQALQVNSIYSTMDSITTLEDKVLNVWKSNGIEYRAEREGWAEFCGRGRWRCGGQQTVPYKEGSREYTPVFHDGELPVKYYPKWL